MLFEANQLLLFTSAAIALNLTPGADMLFCLAQGARSGPKVGVAASVGISTGALIHTLLAALGLAALLAAHPIAFEALRWGGEAGVRETLDRGNVLARTHWGKGFMPEAVSTLARAALEVGYFRVQAFCDVENRPSQRTLEKSGFVREGRLERYSIHPNVSPEPRPCFMYAIRS